MKWRAVGSIPPIAAAIALSVGLLAGTAEAQRAAQPLAKGAPQEVGLGPQRLARLTAAVNCVACLEAGNGSAVAMAANIEPKRNCAAALGAEALAAATPS